MIEVMKGTYAFLYKCIENCNTLLELEMKASHILRKEDDSYWFLEGLIYFTEIKDELYKSEETTMKLRKLKKLLSEAFTYDDTTLLSNIKKIIIIKEYIKALEKNEDIVPLLESSTYFLDNKTKCEVIGKTAAGLDLLGCITTDYLEDTTLEYKLTNKDFKYVLLSYIFSPASILGLIAGVIIYIIYKTQR